MEAVGAGVDGFSPGDRVAYGLSAPGAYAVRRVLPADRLVKLPEAIGEKLAAAVMLKGMTAEYLLRRTYPVQRGETILFHAAAGGTGLLAVQGAKALGATVIGAVSTDEKAALARRRCDHVVVTARARGKRPPRPRGATDHRLERAAAAVKRAVACSVVEGPDPG